MARADAGSRREMILRAAFARLDPIAAAVALGFTAAIVLASATLVLLAKGSPPGVEIGSHLGLLSNFLPGYSVSLSGTVVGLFWGFIIGALAGVGVAAVWNVSHHLYLIVVLIRRGISGGDIE